MIGRRPFILCLTASNNTTPAATLGEYNEAVLSGVLGLSPAEIERLARDGVIGTDALPPSQRKARAMTG